MQRIRDTLPAVVTDDLSAVAQKVVEQVRQETPYPFLLDAKLGGANSPPTPDTEIAAAHGTPPNTMSSRFEHIINDLAKFDQQHDGPLRRIANRANAVMAKAAIINRHQRRPPLYSEATISTLIKMELAAPEHSPLIRAAGYVSPPPIVRRDHDIDFIVADIATHMAQCHQPQSTDQILQSLNHHEDDLAKWPELDITLFISRVSGNYPDDHGFYHPDQPWGSLMSASQLVVNTLLRILERDQQPRNTAYLKDETERLVGHLLPDGYNTLNAIRNVAYTSEEFSWQGPTTFGLRKWETAPAPNKPAFRRGRTGDVVYAFLLQDGPAIIDDVVKSLQKSTSIKERTIREAINRDPENRFVRIGDGRIAANPIPASNNPNAPTLTAVPDGQAHQPAPVLQASEIQWLTHYVQALNGLASPLPSRAALSGRRAAGFALDDTMEITVVVDNRDRPNLESRLAEAAAVASEAVASVQPQISILSPEQWAARMDGETPLPHHNVWLAPDTTP